jgi:hypothetical protein
MSISLISDSTQGERKVKPQILLSLYYTKRLTYFQPTLSIVFEVIGFCHHTEETGLV